MPPGPAKPSSSSRRSSWARLPNRTRHASGQASPMRITADDGHETELEVFGVAGTPTALFLPALGVPISYYQPFLTALADSGLRVHALELRGMPQSSITNVRRFDFGYHQVLSL